MAKENKASIQREGVAPSTSPVISLPKGGGAIRGIGEKFAANPVTGTGAMSVPLATSPGRAGFNPKLSLSYNSGAGNGLFGLGWQLSLPSITRKTEKGLPQYLDTEESDVFLLSGAEDLVPVLTGDGSRWSDTRSIGDVEYRIHRYRPRIEGLFTRIERWTNVADPGDVHWRSISRDNILTLYGKDSSSRIADPEASGRIYSWLICETRDDKGNAIIYNYKKEDGAGADLSQAHESNRGGRDDPRRTANRYIKSIRYGNRMSLLDDEGQRPPFLTDVRIQNAGWMFEVVFDYGEHDPDAPTPEEAGEWAFRDDPFSSYRAGFEIRTTRLCQRVLMFHHFPDEEGVGNDCLVWSSPLASDAGRPMRYVDLMGGQKPHLLVKISNNLGAETCVHYAPSTMFYLADKVAGKPWATQLPFPVHVVERVETYDHIGRNRFVTRYVYHHGYFDGEEREFRGFGMVEQFDTEEIGALTRSGAFPAGYNIDTASHVPPAYIKTWFHTGLYVGRDHVSNFFAGLLDADDKGEYYREPGLTDAQARTLLLPDTVLPDGLTVEEEREASRVLKGVMLRQEVYALDNTDEAQHPYTVTEQNFTIRVLQRRFKNRHAVFFTHPCEAISYHYERNPDDPRITHTLTLEVDDFGNVLKETAIGYGRRQPDPILSAEDQARQTQTLITYTENRYTNAVDILEAHRTPLPCETRTYELTGYTPTGQAGRFQPGDFVQPGTDDPDRLIHRFDSEIPYEALPTGERQRRLIEQLRTLYRQKGWRYT